MGICVRPRPGLIHGGFVGGSVDYRRGATHAFVDRLCDKMQALASSFWGNASITGRWQTSMRCRRTLSDPRSLPAPPPSPGFCLSTGSESSNMPAARLLRFLVLGNAIGQLPVHRGPHMPDKLHLSCARRMVSHQPTETLSHASLLCAGARARSASR
jgi:hypothetical protein